MRHLIPYGLGAAAVGGAVYLYIYVASGGSLESGHPSGSVMLFGVYLAGASAAVGGMLGLAVSARLDPSQRWELSFAQGIIAALVPLPVLGLASDLLVVDLAIWALAGAIGVLLSLGIYVVGRAVVRLGST